MTAPDCILIERREHVAIVTLDRPEARNAINPAVAHGLDAAVKSTNADPDIRVVILTGAGKAFCAGADLKCAALGEGAAIFTPDGGFAGFATADRRKPWIAAVNGAALAGGFELVLGCDLIVASETAVFGLPEVRYGLVAAAGGLARLGRRIPPALALELALTGAVIEARKAFDIGLVNHLVPPDTLMDKALALASAIARNAPLAVMESLNLLRQSHDLPHEELMRLSEDARLRVAGSEDRAEGIRGVHGEKGAAMGGPLTGGTR